MTASLRDVVREESAVRRAVADAERWDRKVAERRGAPREFARREAIAARRRAVRVLVSGLLPPGRARDGLVIRLDGWLIEESIGADALDRLIGVLRGTEEVGGG